MERPTATLPERDRAPSAQIRGTHHSVWFGRCIRRLAEVEQAASAQAGEGGIRESHSLAGYGRQGRAECLPPGGHRPASERLGLVELLGPPSVSEWRSP